MPSFLKLWIPIVVLTIIGFIIVFNYVNPPPPKTISIATGRADGVYYNIAKSYQELLAKDGFTLDIIETAGSEAALELLQQQEVDIAFVQGGVVSSKDTQALVSLASLFYEPLWVFHRGELTSIKMLSDLTGLRISIGEANSGTETLARRLLSENRVYDDNTQLLNLSTEAAKKALQNNEIDAMVTVLNASAPVLKELLSDNAIQLMSFNRALAYSRQFTYLKPLTIGEGMISLTDNIPGRNVELIAATANLVARNELHRDLVRLILKAAKQIHKQGGIFERTNEFPNNLYVDIAMDIDAELYLESGDTWLERTLPFSVASNIKRIIILLLPLLTLLIPLIKGALPLYRWRIRFKIFKWYEVLKEIDSRISALHEEEVVREIAVVTQLLNEVREQTNVPLSYMGEYYNLQLHINLVLQKLERVAPERNNVTIS